MLGVECITAGQGYWIGHGVVSCGLDAAIGADIFNGRSDWNEEVNFSSR